MKTCAQVLAFGMRKLRRITRQMMNIVSAEMPAVVARIESGGISLSAIFITGQVMPHTRQRTTSSSRARASSAPGAAPA